MDDEMFNELMQSLREATAHAKGELELKTTYLLKPLHLKIMHKIKTVSALAKVEMFSLVDEVANNHEPILIATKKNKAVLIGEKEWNSIQETLFLLSVPGMRESIIEGMKTNSQEVLSKKHFFAELKKED